MTFDEWMAEIDRLDPGNCDDFIPKAEQESFRAVYRLIWEGGFTPAAATAEARIHKYLEGIDNAPPRIRLVKP